MIVIILGFLGLVFGSFAGAQVWRLRARQLSRDKKNGDEYDASELARLKKLLPSTRKKKTTADRSRCLECSHKLEWYDLLPLLSWLSTVGKCRYCKKPIGYFEPLMEIGLAVFFVVSYLAWPYPLDSVIEWSRLAVWLASGIPLAILFAYDAKWYLLPDAINIMYGALGVLYVVISLAASQTAIAWLGVVFSVVIMSGIYAALYVISRGRWIGLGDVKLGVGLGLFLLSWQPALLALFLANLIGTAAVLPGLVSRRLNRSSPIPFGPFLMIGTIIAVLFGQLLIDWYLGLVGLSI